MNLNMDLDFDFSGDDAEQGGMLNIPGWYKAVVDDVTEDEKSQGLRVKFKVTEGPHKGAVTSETLYSPDMADDVEKAAQAKRKLGLWAQRLGVWDGKPGPASLDWTTCLGAEVVLNIKTRNWIDKATGKPREITAPDYAGVYPHDHPKIPADVRKTLRLPPARAEAAEATATEKPAQAATTATKAPPTQKGATAKKKVDLSSL